MGDDLVMDRHDAAHLQNVRRMQFLIVGRNRLVNVATCDFGVKPFPATWQKESGSFVRSMSRNERRA
jgi:hypothetical protein